METLRNLWRARDELSVRNIRFSKWNIVLLFAVGIIMGDLRLLDLGDEAMVFGLSSFTAEMMIYSVAILIFAFIPKRLILLLTRIGAVVMLVVLATEIITGLTYNLQLYLLYSFADGLCLGGAVYLFFYYLNNDERLMNMVLISVYYIVCVDMVWEMAREFFINVLPFILIGFFAISVFTIQKKQLPEVLSESEKQGTGASSINPVGIAGMAAVFCVYTIYMIVEILYIFLIYDTNFILTYVFAIGGFVGIGLVTIIQLLLSRNVWYSWTVFLVSSLLSIGLLAWGTPLSANVGSVFYGIAYNLGYIAVFYLVGGAAALSKSLRYYRVFCVVEFVITFFLLPALELLFESIGDSYNFIALGILIVLICVAIAVSPVLNRRIFMTDWVGSLGRIDPQKYAKEIEKVAEVVDQELPSLTPREREIFTMLLTESAPKQIAHELKISTSTFNYHSANLYRKLDVNSRVELMSRYSK